MTKLMTRGLFALLIALVAVSFASSQASATEVGYQLKITNHSKQFVRIDMKNVDCMGGSDQNAEIAPGHEWGGWIHTTTSGQSRKGVACSDATAESVAHVLVGNSDSMVVLVKRADKPWRASVLDLGRLRVLSSAGPVAIYLTVEGP